MFASDMIRQDSTTESQLAIDNVSADNSYQIGKLKEDLVAIAAGNNSYGLACK